MMTNIQSIDPERLGTEGQIDTCIFLEGENRIDYMSGKGADCEVELEGQVRKKRGYGFEGENAGRNSLN